MGTAFPRKAPVMVGTMQGLSSDRGGDESSRLGYIHHEKKKNNMEPGEAKRQL